MVLLPCEKNLFQKFKIRKVEISIPVKDLAFFDDRAHEWVVEQDRFTFYCAASSMDIKSSITVNVK
jgi:beta-glucosidase